MKITGAEGSRPCSSRVDKMTRAMPQPVKVLYIIDTLMGLNGGAEGALLRTVRLLPQDRYSCTVVTFKTRPGIPLQEFLCPVHVLPMERTYGWRALNSALELRRLIRSLQVDIVHTFFATSDLWGGLVARLSGCPVVISSRRDMGILRTWKHKLGYRFSNRLFDQVQAVSEQVRLFSIQEDGIDPKKVITIYNGIEMERFTFPRDSASIRPLLGLDDVSRVIVSVGNLRQVKGHDVLVRAAGKVCQEFPQALFLIAGDVHEPETFQRLEYLVASLGIQNNVRFLNFREDTPLLLGVADIFCLASRSEGMSNALLEAMASGLPCVTTSVGGNPEVVQDGASGFLVPVEDANALAERILVLLRNPVLARRMGEYARDTVAREFTAERMARKTGDAYDSLLRTHGRA